MISPILYVKHKTLGDSIEYHEKILKAIKRHDPAKARIYMHRHLVQVRKVVRDIDFRPRLRGENDDEPDGNPG